MNMDAMALSRTLGLFGITVYIAVALLWLYVVNGIVPTWHDYAGAGMALLGAAVIALGYRGD